MEIWPVYNPDAAIMPRYLYDRMDTRVRASSSINGLPGVNAANNTDPFLSFHSIATVPAWRGVAWPRRPRPEVI